MSKVLFIAVLIPALLILPYLLTDSAYAYKLTDKEIKIEVIFKQSDVTNIPQMIVDFDSGLIEDNMYDVLAPVAVGQFLRSDIVADWSLSVNHDTRVHKLQINPLITEINVNNGVSQETIVDAMLDDGKNQVRTWLQNYGITEYTWYMYYEGGLLIVEESTI